MQGKVINLTGGLYSVIDDESNKVYKVRARGSFRHQNISPIVGDNVLFDSEMILNIIDRKNEFIRPKVANIDYAIIITPVYPKLSIELLNNLLFVIEREYVEPIIVVSKCDLVSEEELKNIKETLSYYERFYKVFYSSKQETERFEEFKVLLKDKISVFTGQTGAGKSFLLNRLSPELKLQTQEISKALGRGKHTTREVTIYDVDHMYIADSPGFSSIDLTLSKKMRPIIDCFPEFKDREDCRFNDCRHLAEPGCKVKELVEEGKASKERYDFYIKVLTNKDKPKE